METPSGESRSGVIQNGMFNQGFTTQLSKVYSRMERVLGCIHVLADYGYFFFFPLPMKTDTDLEEP